MYVLSLYYFLFLFNLLTCWFVCLFIYLFIVCSFVCLFICFCLFACLFVFFCFCLSFFIFLLIYLFVFLLASYRSRSVSWVDFPFMWCMPNTDLVSHNHTSTQRHEFQRWAVLSHRSTFDRICIIRALRLQSDKVITYNYSEKQSRWKAPQTRPFYHIVTYKQIET